MIAPWAEEEVGAADLGDGRLDERLVVLLSALGSRPNLSIPAACGGRAEMEAAYRFFDNDKVTFDKVLEPHMDQTVRRLADQEVALLVQDTTEVDLTRPEQEVIGAGTLDGSRRGFLLHLLHAFTPQGVPLGTVGAEVLNRTGGTTGASAKKRSERASTPIEAKESFRWLEGLRQARQVAEQVPHMCCVYVADSEADIYELFAEPRGESGLHWLIRACQDRAVVGASEHLRDHVLATPVRYEVTLQVRARRAKIGADERARRQSRSARQTTATVRAAALPLRPPWRADRQLPPVTVNVVLVSELDPPVGEVPVEWLLLTTLPIETVEQVRTVVAYYSVRWEVEVLFRTLKSGCRIEHRRFEHVARVLPCLGLYLIVAWRTQFVCRLGQDEPELNCEAIFEPSEWKAVWATVKRQPPPKRPPPLRDVLQLIAGLGGYVKRPNNEPGVQTLWIGLQRTYDLALAWDSFGPGSARNDK
jgi:hypothetical protein